MIPLKKLGLALEGKLNAGGKPFWYEPNEVHLKLEQFKREDSMEQFWATIDTCPDPECLTCGHIACPLGEPMHFHHDGCPAWCDE